jgi:hypothetical protein
MDSKSPLTLSKDGKSIIKVINRNITTIDIPDNITMIGEYTFKDCTGLTSIVIPKSVTEIGWGAFMEGMILEII